MTQYPLVEGLAAIALTLVVVALAVAGVALARTSWSLKAAT